MCALLTIPVPVTRPTQASLSLSDVMLGTQHILRGAYPSQTVAPNSAPSSPSIAWVQGPMDEEVFEELTSG